MAKGTDYSTYLHINDLLKLQVPLTDNASDELLFIVVHQSYELWFKVIIDELQRSPLRLLDTMSPEGFLEFRYPLDPASGFQSFQFRAIEFLSGGGSQAMLTYELFDDEQRACLKERSELPQV